MKIQRFLTDSGVSSPLQPRISAPQAMRSMSAVPDYRAACRLPYPQTNGVVERFNRRISEQFK
jgi:hypothetical protein